MSGRRWIFPLLASYVAGISLSPYLQAHSGWHFLPPLWALFFLLFRHRPSARRLCLLFFSLFLGISLYLVRMAPSPHPDHVSAWAMRGDLRMEGRILSVTPGAEDRWTLDLEMLGRFDEDLRAYPLWGKARLYTRGKALEVAPGDRIRFFEELRLPRLFGTPGEFHFPRYLATLGVGATAFVPEALDLLKIAEPKSQKSLLARLQRGRMTLGLHLRELIPELSPYVRALSLGDKGGIEASHRKLLSATGLAHLFAISGLHFAMVGALFYALGSRLYRLVPALSRWEPSQRVVPLLIIPLLGGYYLLTGAAVPAFRAFLLALALALLLALRQRCRPMDLLALAAFVILLIDPLLLFAPSFQLSFAGVAGLLLSLPRWQGRLSQLPRMLRYPLGVLVTTMAATLATAPFVLWHFQSWAPAALLTNLFALPLVGFVAVPLVLGATLLHGLCFGAGDLLFRGCALVLELVLEMATAVRSLPGLGGGVVILSPPEILGAGLIACVLLCGISRKNWRLALTAALVGGTLLVLPPWSRPGLRVVALSVGQGDATLVSLGDQHYLIDGGGLYSDRFDVGESLVAPALARLGVRKLSAVILTHDHPDHSKGLPFVLEHFEVERFWSPVAPQRLNSLLLQTLQNRNISMGRIAPGWNLLNAGADGTLSLYQGAGEGGSNDLSQVVFAAWGGRGVLLTGDLEAEGVEMLALQGAPGPVDLLKLPHHGSAHSRSEVLVNLWRPLLAFVSAGVGNRFGHPAPEILRHVEDQGGQTYRTDRDATLLFEAAEQGWVVRRWSRGLFR